MAIRSVSQLSEGDTFKVITFEDETECICRTLKYELFDGNLMSYFDNNYDGEFKALGELLVLDWEEDDTTQGAWIIKSITTDINDNRVMTQERVEQDGNVTTLELEKIDIYM